MKFNLFTKSAVLEIAPKKYSSSIEKIHHEFETSSDELYNQMIALIGATVIPSASKIETLKLLGFNKCKEVVEIGKKVDEVEMGKKLAKTISYYRQNYPFNKFITEEKVKQICEKYNLVFGEVSDYTGFVPENIVNKISKFSLKKQDENFIFTNNPLLTFLNAEVRQQGNYYHIYKIGEKDNYNYAFQSDDGKSFYANDSKNLFGYSNLGGIRFSIVNKDLKICAPLKDFDMTGKQLQDYKIIKQAIPDPVVLKAVKDGYLILAAWGDEASDPIVVNEINN